MATNKQVYKAERGISDILFGLAMFVTAIAMGMMLVEFFARGTFFPTKIGTFYIGVLALYAVHKEAVRWMSDPKSSRPNRPGEYFVYVWVVLTTLLYLLDFVTHNYYTVSDTGQELGALFGITITTLEVGVVFILTRGVKTMFRTIKCT